MNQLVAAIHDATHLVPGVPAHSDTPAVQRPPRDSRLHNRSPRVQNQNRHHGNPPRILVGWQNWIARMVGQKNTLP